MQKITPFLWFDGRAEEAAKFYVSIFSSVGGSASGGKNSEITGVMHGQGGAVAGVTFTLDGVKFMALNGGPQFHFTEAISLFVNCESQEEVDEFWEKLSEGGTSGQCGWLKDKFGLSWQVIPSILMKYMSDPDPKKANATMQAMLQMGKIDISKLKEAYEGVK